MSILFGTDFSEAATQAAQAAAALAASLKEPLILVHVLDTSDLESASGQDHPPLKSLKSRLHQEAQQLSRAGVEVQSEVLVGIPDEVLLEFAQKSEARLILLSALGRRQKSWWRLGSTSERVAQASKIPVLILRDLAAFTAWAEGSKPLTIVLAYDFSATSRAALEWVSTLLRLGPCNLIVSYVYWPPEQHSRLGLQSSLELLQNESQIEQILLRDLEHSVGKLEGPSTLQYRVLFSFGRVADPLAGLVEREEADLLVLGTHQRKGLSRLWHGSAVRGVLQNVPCSVAVVPESAVHSSATAIPRIQSILVPTDLSDLGNNALPQACALLPAGGIVHFVHVQEKHRSVQETEQERHRLREAVPASITQEAHRRGIQIRTALVDGPDTAKAIRQAAERLGVDLICLASHGRTGVSRALAGSVAQDLLKISRVPVLLLRNPTEP